MFGEMKQESRHGYKNQGKHSLAKQQHAGRLCIQDLEEGSLLISVWKNVHEKINSKSGNTLASELVHVYNRNVKIIHSVMTWIRKAMRYQRRVPIF